VDAWLGELTTKGEKEAKQRQPVQNNFELGNVKIIVERKEGKWACTLIEINSFGDHN